MNLKESTLKVKAQEKELVRFWEVKWGKKVTGRKMLKQPPKRKT